MILANKKYDYYDNQKIDNLKDLLKYRLDNTPDDIAFSYKENDIIIKKTFRDVSNDVDLLSSYFYKTHRNKHIAIMGENSYNFIITYFAIVLSGNVCVILNKDLSVEDTKIWLKKSDSKAIYYSSYYCLFVKDINIKSYPLEDLDEYIKIGRSAKNKYKIDSDKDSTIFFTSGTTGANKCVMLSQKNMARDIYGAACIYKPHGKVVSFLPYHHAFGFVTSVLKPYYYGCETFINKSLKYVSSDIKENKPETLFAVPAFIEMFYKQIWKSARKQNNDKRLKHMIRISNNLLKLGIDIRKKVFKSILDEFGGNLNYIICGGAYLSPKYIKWFRSIGIEILNGYGITECSPVVSVNRNNFHRDGSVGQICRGVNVKIIDNEICVNGDIVMKGYYKDKKATSSVLIDNYYHTGDLGYIDNDGFLFITGRKKNLIILSNGENISPEEIETVLLNDKAVNEVVVYEEENKIIASIYPNEDYFGDQDYFDNLIYEYNKTKPKNHQISLVKLRTNQFEKNSSLKILRSKVVGGKLK